MVLVLLGQGFNLLLQLLTGPGGLLQLLKLAVTGLDALRELGDLGLSLLELGVFVVEVLAGNETLPQSGADLGVQLLRVGIA